MARRLEDPREPTPLRRARLARTWTLEDVVEQMDLRAPGGHSGVTPSMVSGWELGRHATSLAHRKTLCDIYQMSATVLFAYQDEDLGKRAAPQLVVGPPHLHRAMVATVEGARDCLVIMGSRSRNEAYLRAVESALERRPALVYYRVLFGPPHHQVLMDHLLRLLALRDPHDRSLAVKTLHVGIVEEGQGMPERFFCASERQAVVPIPSLTSLEAFDSGVMLGAGEALRLLDHGRQAYAASRRIETLQQIGDLAVVRAGQERA
ncbi:helix-turn-helix domain-containing protein [Sphaerisporangium sp. NBC_01403]|uniref:helix-turn-helix domain-containing protein n=1 Tax=Sphaerisporangium sp. NBC_01403 TaxID=2903599 RepID=UPI003244E202